MWKKIVNQEPNYENETSCRDQEIRRPLKENQIEGKDEETI